METSASSLAKLSHILAVAPKFYAAREKVTGVQISDVGGTATHFSRALIAIVNANVDVDDTESIRRPEAVKFRPNAKFDAPMTVKTLEAFNVVVALIADDTLRFLTTDTETDAAMAIVAAPSSVLSFCPYMVVPYVRNPYPGR